MASLQDLFYLVCAKEETELIHWGDLRMMLEDLLEAEEEKVTWQEKLYNEVMREENP